MNKSLRLLTLPLALSALAFVITRCNWHKPTITGFALIPAGSFQMGDQSNPLAGGSNELPVHGVHVSAFYMAKHLVTKEDWDAVRVWGMSHGYTDLAAGQSKGENHPVHAISWDDIVKWCNARSEMEGLTACYLVSGVIYQTGSSNGVVCNWSANGYRLPTEAEWEKAARGGLEGKNFPWGNTISHKNANFYNNGNEGFQTGAKGYDQIYGSGAYPYTSPVASFTPNGYGLYDMSGNLFEWCWDYWGNYTAGLQTDPRGPASGSVRVFRGGSWFSNADDCRLSSRNEFCDPLNAEYGFGFRVARSSVP